MNKIKLLSLRLGGRTITFKDGVNYIVGDNNSGKTLIFNSIKYSMGILSKFDTDYFECIELNVNIGDKCFTFFRNVGSRKIRILTQDDDFSFVSGSHDLNKFYQKIFDPKYIYNLEHESMLEVLDFCFITETKTRNRRQELNAIKSILGINTGLIKIFEKEFVFLKDEVRQDKERERLICDFSKLIINDANQLNDFENLSKIIDLSKKKYIDEYRSKENLLKEIKFKLNELTQENNSKFESDILIVESEFIELVKRLNLSIYRFDGLENFIINKYDFSSYGEDLVLRFLLILSIVIRTNEGDYNLPSLIVNDSYLSWDIRESVLTNITDVIEEIFGDREDFQYLEFTHRNNVPKDKIVHFTNNNGGNYEFN